MGKIDRNVFFLLSGKFNLLRLEIKEMWRIFHNYITSEQFELENKEIGVILNFCKCLTTFFFTYNSCMVLVHRILIER